MFFACQQYIIGLTVMFCFILMFFSQLPRLAYRPIMAIQVLTNSIFIEPASSEKVS